MRTNPEAILVAAPTRQQLQHMNATSIIDEITSLFAAIEIGMAHIEAFAKTWCGIADRNANGWVKYYALLPAISLPMDGMPKQQLLKSERYKYFPNYTTDLNSTLAKLKANYAQRQSEENGDVSQMEMQSEMETNLSTVETVSSTEAEEILRKMIKDILLLPGKCLHQSHFTSGGQLVKLHWKKYLLQLGFPVQKEKAGVIGQIMQDIMLVLYRMELIH